MTVSHVRQLVDFASEILVSRAVIKAERANARSKSDLFMRAAIAALLNDEDEAADAALKDDAFKPVKGLRSSARDFAKFLKAGNKLPAPSTAKAPWIINGQNVTVVTAEHLAALAVYTDVSNVETPVSTLCTAWRARRKFLAEQSEMRLTGEDEAIAAYLRANADKYPGEDVQSLRATTERDELAVMIRAGEDILRAERAEHDKREAEQAALSRLNNALAFVAEASGEAWERLYAAFLDKSAKLATANRQVTGGSQRQRQRRAA